MGRYVREDIEMVREWVYEYMRGNMVYERVYERA